MSAVFSNHREIKILLLISLITVIFYSLDLGSWKFSFVGDEWPFYSFAKKISDTNFLINPFRMDGVFNEHRVLGSLWQALFIKLFWFYPMFGWRFSNVILIVPIAFFYFYWLKNLFNQQTAILSTLLLCSSFYLANFFKIGYLNPIALALIIIDLYLATKAGQTQKTKHYLLLAIVLGLSFYVYIGPVFPAIIWPCLFLTRPKISRATFTKYLAFSLLYLAIISIGPLTSAKDWFLVSNKTFLHREFNSSWQILVNIYRNFILFYKNFDYSYNHFVTGPYLDQITQILCLMGTVISLQSIKQTGYRIIIFLFILTCLVIGYTSPYSYAPTTRGIFFLPFGCAFAGIGLDLLRPFIKTHGVVVICLLVFFLNFYLSRTWVFSQTGYSKNALILRELINIKKLTSVKYVVYVASDYTNYNYANISSIKNAYQLDDLTINIVPPIDFNCLDIPNISPILFFDNDLIAKTTVYQSNCPGHLNIINIKDKYLF